MERILTEKEMRSGKEATPEREAASERKIASQKEMVPEKEAYFMNEKDLLAAIRVEDTVPYGLANDYMFHAVLQSSEEALRGLLSALLYIPEAEILSCIVLNPIMLEM